MLKINSVFRRFASTEVFNKLVLIRHGESEWNKLNLFTGWVDCPLSAKGCEEAIEAGKLLKQNGFQFDYAYTSVLSRAIKTLYLSLEHSDQLFIPVEKAWELNERHYGALQGLNKKETVEKHGEEQVKIWRRSYDIPPPPVDPKNEKVPCIDRRYKYIKKKSIPLTESLQLTEARVVPFFEKHIKPAVQKGRKIVVAAHGNSLRALVKYLDNIDKDVITGLNIPTGVPLVYEFNEKMEVIPSQFGMKPLRGYYLGDQDAIRARVEAVANQTKK
uniref:Phosphoglycerate mutase n=1 Tax=Opalinidae sp. TaxID=2059444 RepID=A0A649V0A1_9STRA|nr:phosphoglycerate kinase [Opalinidae sp.]